jgi:hypothetical protein
MGAEFDADFESVDKKIMRKKLSTKGDRKLEFLTVITVCKGFWPITFLWTFLHFFQQIRTQHWTLRFVIPISEAPANGDGYMYCTNVIEWMYGCYKNMKNKQKEWHVATKLKKKKFKIIVSIFFPTLTPKPVVTAKKTQKIFYKSVHLVKKIQNGCTLMCNPLFPPPRKID